MTNAEAITERTGRRKNQARAVPPIAPHVSTFRLLPRMLIIDEIQHLLSCSAREQRAALNMIKFLSNDRRMTIVAAGTHEALHVMRFDPQIASRFEQMELPVWTESEELRRSLPAILQCCLFARILL